MLHYWLYSLSSAFPPFNIFKYITFRTGGAILTSLLISFIFGQKIINWLKKRQKEGQPIRDDGPESHLITKKGTPTMGGSLILLALGISTLLWGDLTNHFIWGALFVTFGFGALGAIDDFQKLTRRTHHGISGRVKLMGQFFLSMGAIIIVQYFSPSPLNTQLYLPFIKDISLSMGPFFILWGAFVMVGSSNAVNLTDGLDGLAIVPVMIAGACFGLIAYLVGNTVFASYLQILYVPNAGEMTVFVGALIGAGLGFLWFNAPPAKVFMGDTGSLAAGAVLGYIAVMTKHEIVLSIIGGLFVMEAVSVILQVGYYKLTKKRIFLMAPIHHHFEKKGWAEATVVIRFWIIATILALIGLSTLKIR
jgi:phospho-N-acetylmuramoyl-pentapeptide-transferase